MHIPLDTTLHIQKFLYRYMHTSTKLDIYKISHYSNFFPLMNHHRLLVFCFSFLLEHSCFTMLLVSIVRQIESVILLYMRLYVCVHAQFCPALCDPMDCSLPGQSLCGISQARILEWSTISYYRGSSQPSNQTTSPALAGKFFTC